MSNVNKLRKICPYTGQGEGQECKMTKGGLYIPMPEHIEMFCQTPKFVECHQYIRGSELLKETAQKYGFILDGSRRRYRRVLDRFMVSLAVCDENGTPKEILDENAHTIDISLGGMRIDSSSDIAGRGLIAFEFGSDFIMPILEGVGEIKWATEIKGNGGKGSTPVWHFWTAGFLMLLGLTWDCLCSRCLPTICFFPEMRIFIPKSGKNIKPEK